ncbi:hypothetical protein GYMLUDRAFT_66212 [Collybiopsis luxurians FD-317 M1]|nr:hypothetical protein GYMLUDRAFT_66212 [Collybiopsis luxurians FD-317 M1]
MSSSTDNNIIAAKGHSEGVTCLSFAVDGIHAFTGGSDSTVRIWKVTEESEPGIVTEAEEPVTSLAVSDDYWLSSSEDSYVRRYIKDREEFHGNVTDGASLPVRCIALDPKGRRLAVTSDNPVAKVVDMEDTLKVMLLNGHKHNVRKASWHPIAPILSTCASDGKIIIWDLSGEDPVIVHTLDGVIPSVTEPSSPEFWHDCSAVWHPSGSHFYIISKTHDIICISSKNWIQTGKLTDHRVTGATTALAISPNGAYLATACGTTVFIWRTDRREIVNSKTPANRGGLITQISFSPTDNLVAWTDTSGQFMRWPNPIPTNLPNPVERLSGPTGTTSKNLISSKSDHFPKTDLFAEDTDTTLHAVISYDSDIQGHEADNRKNGASEDEDGLGNANFDIDDTDFVIDDVGGYLEDTEDHSMKHAKGRDDDGGGLVREMVSITKAQPAFQPGSTPFQGKKRYLAYNMLGVIEATQPEQEEYNLVSVDFFDKTARRSYHFNDTHKCHLAYLGYDTTVLYKPYGSWTTSQNDWTYMLKNSGTKVIGIAAGGMTPSRSFRNNQSDGDLMGFGNVVVATSQGHLVFLSGTGRPRRLIALGGDFITMVAGDEWVMVVYRAGATTIDGSQSLQYKMYNFEDLSVRQRDELPIPKGHTLKWIGITHEGAPVIYDSSGMVHLVAKYRVPHHATWVCMLDANLLARRAGKDESYWPVGITGSTFMCLILKGRQEFPGFPRPLVQELPLRIPFDTDNEKEEMYVTQLLPEETKIEQIHDEELTTDEILSRERAVDKEFVALIQGACKEDNIHRAIELTKLLHNVQTFDIVAKIADFYHLVGFREKVEVLKQIREDSEDRFEAAREKRRRWNKVDSRPQRLLNDDANGNSLVPKSKPLQDFGPPPAIFRPGLSRATPAVEDTKYSSNATFASTPGSNFDSDGTWTDPLDSSPNHSSSEKRKRSDADDVEMESQSNIGISMLPPKQKSNPFARKPIPDKNPFARKAINKPILKSESFFEKVDAAEKTPAKSTKRAGNAGKGREKEKMDTKGPRQQTLFGLFGASENGDLKKQAYGMKKPSPESQMSDIMMADASQITETQIETQLDDEETQEVM